MSYAEQTAYKLYDTMHLDAIDDDVKKCLILLLTTPQANDAESNESPLPDFETYEEAMALGAEDIETFSKEMHEYIDELCEEYDIR